MRRCAATSSGSNGDGGWSCGVCGSPLVQGRAGRGRRRRGKADGDKDRRRQLRTGRRRQRREGGDMTGRAMQAVGESGRGFASGSAHVGRDVADGVARRPVKLCQCGPARRHGRSGGHDAHQNKQRQQRPRHAARQASHEQRSTHGGAIMRSGTADKRPIVSGPRQTYGRVPSGQVARLRAYGPRVGTDTYHHDARHVPPPPARAARAIPTRTTA